MTTHAPPQAARAVKIDGPLKGHHRLWHVVTPDDEPTADRGRLKVEEPREGALWFDRRSFLSEGEVLLRLLEIGVPRIPPVLRAGSPAPVILSFIEGDPLNELAPAGTAVHPDLVDQITQVFSALARVCPKTVDGWGIDTKDVKPPADSAQFLQNLIRFTRHEVYEERRREFGHLFDRLGISAAPLAPRARLASAASQLTDRPFCLLHGDLHRANFIVDASYGLWTIDWELATLGDPLYDLATHLYLMRYPAEQEREVTEQWRATVEKELPGAAAGLDADLPRYLAFKRVQSVYTDVVRHAIKIRACETPGERKEQLKAGAKAVRDALVRAGDCLEPRARTTRSIKSIYDDFCRPR